MDIEIDLFDYEDFSNVDDDLFKFLYHYEMKIQNKTFVGCVWCYELDQNGFYDGSESENSFICSTTNDSFSLEDIAEELNLNERELERKLFSLLKKELANSHFIYENWAGYQDRFKFLVLLKHYAVDLADIEKNVSSFTFYYKNEEHDVDVEFFLENNELFFLDNDETKDFIRKYEYLDLIQ